MHVASAQPVKLLLRLVNSCCLLPVDCLRSRLTLLLLEDCLKLDGREIRHDWLSLTPSVPYIHILYCYAAA